MQFLLAKKDVKSNSSEQSPYRNRQVTTQIQSEVDCLKSDQNLAHYGAKQIHTLVKRFYSHFICIRQASNLFA